MTPGYAAEGSITALVVTEAGAPIAGVAASLNGPAVHRATVTNARGVALFPNIARGTYAVTFTFSKYAPLTMRNVAVHGAAVNLGRVVLHPSLTALGVIGSVVARERLPFNTSPAAVKVFPREAYRDQGQASLAAVLDQTPGAIVARSASDLNWQPMSPYYATVRGGLPWETAMLIDGNPVSLPSTGTFDLAYVPSFLLQDVEIAKGYGAAETTVFGAEDGALNLRTAEPGSAFKGLLEIEGDDRGGQFSDFAYGGSTKDGRFAFTTMLAADGNPGPDASVPLAGTAFVRSQLLKARFQLSPGAQLTATFLGSQGSLGVAQSRAFTDGGSVASFANSAGAQETHRLGMYSLELHGDWGFDHLTAKAYQLQVQRTGTYDAFAFPAIGSGIDALDNVLGFSVQDDHQIGSSLYQLQLTHESGSDYAVPLVPRTARRDRTMVRGAAKVRASAYTDVQLAAAFLQDAGSGRAFGVPVVHAGAAFHVRPNVTARISAGSGAVAPPDAILGKNPLAFLVETPVGLPPHLAMQRTDPNITQETSFGYDAGVEYRLHGETTTLSADVYHTVIHGTFVDQSSGTPALWQYVWTNASPLTHDGLELSLQQFKRVGFGFIASASLLRNYVSDRPPYANLSGGPLLQPGSTQIAPLRIPYAQGYAEISYKWPRGSRASLGALYLGSNNAYGRPAFVQANANLELSLNDYSKLQFSVQNLTNAYTQPLSVLVPGAVPYIAGVAGPRTFRFMFRQSVGGSLFER